MDNQIKWLKISYWSGAVIDAITALMMFFPDAPLFSTITRDLPRNPYERFQLWEAAPLMVGWTVLLLWANHKPLERKGVLLITVIPVILGMAFLNVYAFCTGLAAMDKVLLPLIMQTLLTILFTASYFNARDNHQEKVVAV